MTMYISLLLKSFPDKPRSFPLSSVMCPRIGIYLLVTGLLLAFPASVHAIAGDVSPTALDESETDALHALKADFNPSTVLNWSGRQPCNNPPTWYGIQCRDGRVIGISLEGIGLAGKIRLHALVNLTQLRFLSFGNNSISGTLMDFSANKKLTHVDLSDNMFVGPISRSLLDLESLESLQLQGNNLSGSIPEFNQLSLKKFSVSYNHLSGNIPTTPVLQSFDSSSFLGNPGLCGPPSSITCEVENEVATPPSDTKLNTKPAVVVFVILVIIALVVVLVMWYKNSKKIKKETNRKDFVRVDNRRSNDKRIELEERREVASEEKKKLTFTGDHGGFELGDLLKASAEGLGQGNFGLSYKAIMENGRSVVVKRLRDLRPLDTNEFMRMMRLLADQKHPNLLPLLAYFHSKEENLLIYEFAQKGNLYNRIHEGRGGNNRIPFKWSSRLAVAYSVGRAMEFLHSNWSSQTIIPHGDLKASNVLIDENDMVLVADYGLASLIAVPVAADKMVAYKSPEYQYSGKVSTKSDVWSYGSLLLELLTGKVSTHSAPEGFNGVDLSSWVHRAVREEWTAEIFDSEISARRNASEGMVRLLQIAIRCCEKSPEKRPVMGEVVKEIERIKLEDTEEDDEFSIDLAVSDYPLSTRVQG